MAIKMIICTCGDDFAIGKNGKLLTHCAEDLQYFKKCTDRQVVLMGRKTFDSINKALHTDSGLPNRFNLVITKDKSLWTKAYQRDLKVMYVSGVEAAMCIIRLKGLFEHKDTWICGGSSIYSQFKDLAEEVHHTNIDKEFEADTFFDMNWVKDEDVFEIVCGKQLTDDAQVVVYRKVNKEEK